MTSAEGIVASLPVPVPGPAVPALFTDSGAPGTRRLVEWLTADIRNANTRASYFRAVRRFAGWCQARQLQLKRLTPVHVAAYIEELGTVVDKRGKTLSKPTVKQHLAALKVLGDYLVTGQIIPANPFAPVRGPKYVVKTGKTPVLTAAEMRQLLDRINLIVDEHGRIVAKPADQFTLADLRDRSLIAVMAYGFARVSAALAMDVDDYRRQGHRHGLALHEKGGKEHVVPCHQQVRDYLDTYIAAAGIAGQRQTPLFRTLDRKRRLTDTRLGRREALAMVKRRATAAGLGDHVCCHSFRATGITVYLQCGGSLETAQMLAAHESPRTTKLYDRTQDQVSQEEVERIQF